MKLVTTVKALSEGAWNGHALLLPSCLSTASSLFFLGLTQFYSLFIWDRQGLSPQNQDDLKVTALIPEAPSCWHFLNITYGFVSFLPWSCFCSRLDEPLQDSCLFFLLSTFQNLFSVSPIISIFDSILIKTPCIFRMPSLPLSFNSYLLSMLHICTLIYSS